MVKVTIIWTDDEGNEIPEEYQIGDTKELGSIMRSQLTLTDIQIEAFIPEAIDIRARARAIDISNLHVALIPRYLQEVCTDCGRSVALGSGDFVNRIPDGDSLIEKIERGCPYPCGEFKCARCEELLNRNQDTEGLTRYTADFGSQFIYALDLDDANFQVKKLITERDIVIDRVFEDPEEDEEDD